ncbi:MAG: CvpA family protein [Rhodospirillales bacterium]|nr:CvpA family protein [Rhodospirillales bacterium]
MLDSLPINAFDGAVAVVVLVSALIALLRGFVKEVLSLAAWAGAALVTLWGFAMARPYFRALIDSQLLADAAAGVALFVVSLIVFAMIAHGTSALVRRSASLSAIDRSLGFVFGIFRGFVLLGLAWLALAWAIPEEKRPDWIFEARTRPLVERMAEFLVGLAPPEFRGQVRTAGDQAQRGAEALKALEKLQPNPPSQPNETGYKRDEVQGLEQLIDRVRPSAPTR